MVLEYIFPPGSTERGSKLRMRGDAAQLLFQRLGSRVDDGAIAQIGPVPELWSEPAEVGQNGAPGWHGLNAFHPITRDELFSNDVGGGHRRPDVLIGPTFHDLESQVQSLRLQLVNRLDQEFGALDRAVVGRVDDEHLSAARVSPAGFGDWFPVLGIDSEAVRPEKILPGLESGLIGPDDEGRMTAEIKHAIPDLVAASEQVRVRAVHGGLCGADRAGHGDVASVRDHHDALAGQTDELTLERSERGAGKVAAVVGEDEDV